ncbi:MAG: 3-dehydroquinate synthase [Anaerolineales bacterium]|nr:3-dehydroquinate synthase [Anaerolineales bacterium]
MNLNISSHLITNSRQSGQADSRLLPENLVLFGPPGVGKTSVGKLLAKRLGRPFIDMDETLERQLGQTINSLFLSRGEAGFRQLEAELCSHLACQSNLVVASGGGTLLGAECRASMLASGRVILLTASEQKLADRLLTDPPRPLLNGDLRAELRELLSSRKQIYDLFTFKVDTDEQSADQIVDTILKTVSEQDAPASAAIQSPKPGYEIRLGSGLYYQLDELVAELKLQPPFIIISDSNVGPIYATRLQSALNAALIQFPAGEHNKSIASLERIYRELAKLGMERSGTLIALGGGVVGDLAGFAAATFMRGVRWINLPTSLLAMVDASIGGKVGIDLNQGKNLVGAFHQPSLVISDTDTLQTLPGAEFRSGLMEMIKAAIIADPLLFRWFEENQNSPSRRWLERAIKVKADIVQQDPYESGARAHLNLGHTVGHGLEAASGYARRHGEAIALGTLIEAEIAEDLNVAEEDLAIKIEAVLQRWGLPTQYKGIEPDAILRAMMMDKKKQAGRLRFALPLRVGQVELRENVPEATILKAIERRLET